jgi:hypothetical protein
MASSSNSTRRPDEESSSPVSSTPTPTDDDFLEIVDETTEGEGIIIGGVRLPKK